MRLSGIGKIAYPNHIRSGLIKASGKQIDTVSAPLEGVHVTRPSGVTQASGLTGGPDYNRRDYNMIIFVPSSSASRSE